MSDVSQGEGRWQASDGKWYSPESHPGTAAAAELPADALLQTKSHEAGRNSDVTLYPDRIERVRQKSLGSLSKAKQDTEVIPMKSVSSVQAKKDGLIYTKVTVFTSGNTIDFRVRHAEAQTFKDAITQLLLQPASAASTGPPVSLADELIKLGKLRDDGLLTDVEFEAQKAKLLGP
jgi:hypothetical protein